MNESVPSWTNIAVSISGEIVELRFHTNDASLVWDATAHREAAEAFAWVGTRRSTRVLIITGTGADYCASIDVPTFADTPWDEIWWEGRRMLMNLSDIDIPVIAAVNGPATVHSEIPVLADIVLASDTATFGDHVHITRNTVPGDGVHAVWAGLLGPSRVRYFLLTAETISVQEARSLGFVHEILTPDTLSARAWELAESLASKPRSVLRFSKATVAISSRRFLSEDISHGMGLEGSGHWTDGGIKP